MSARRQSTTRPQERVVILRNGIPFACDARRDEATTFVSRMRAFSLDTWSVQGELPLDDTACDDERFS